MKVSFIWDKAAGAFFVRDADTGEVQTLANGARWYITCPKCHKGRIVARDLTEDSVGVCRSCGEEFPPGPKYDVPLDFCYDALKLIDDHQGDRSEIVEQVEAVQVEKGYIKPMVKSPDEFAALMREAAKPKSRQAAKLDAHELDKAISRVEAVDLTIPRNELFEAVDLLFRSGASVESFWHRANAIEVMLATLENSVRRLEEDMKAALEKMGGAPQTAKRTEEDEK